MTNGQLGIGKEGCSKESGHCHGGEKFQSKKSPKFPPVRRETH